MFIKRMVSKHNIFYGWLIVAAGFILMATTMGIANNAASLFLKPVSEDLGFTRQQVNITTTIRFACQAVLAFFSGKIFVKYNVKRLMEISAIVLPVAYFSYSFSNTLITYYAITILVSIGVTLLTILPLSLIINNWFYERQGFAIGVAFMGSGVGGMIFNSLAGLWLTKFGWRITYRYLAIIMFLIVIPCVFFVVYIHPKDLGLEALGQPIEDKTKTDKRVEEGLLLSEALKTKQFWVLSLAAVGMSMSINTLMMNVAPHLTDVGYSTAFSANIVALIMGSMAIFKVVLGQLYDNLGLRIATTIACLSVLIGLSGLILAKYTLALVVIVICVGFGSSLGTIANPIITRETFGRRDYSSIFGMLTAVSGIGGMVAPIIDGYIYDTRGSYNMAYILAAIIILVTIVMYQFVFTKKIEV